MNKLNMSLDDIIGRKDTSWNKSKSVLTQRRRKPQGRIGFILNLKNGFRHQQRRPRQINVFTRLKVKNLHYNVMNDDLNKMFSPFGKLKRCGIHWDNAGISKGTADVEFFNRKDAIAAKEELDGHDIEGMKLSIELV